ncbi:hypothetical protein pdam_00023031 [Pocillopora damicornis]|uniref:Uncharacterized protein n=1 Tax=Pocillopora damicornis TaxID=46731 RepID=A0A3M6V1Q3_POCDA|nr:hypothetical protein pdam_00023031 [Pocillopora damicornis]
MTLPGRPPFIGVDADSMNSSVIPQMHYILHYPRTMVSSYLIAHDWSDGTVLDNESWEKMPLLIITGHRAADHLWKETAKAPPL